MVRFPAVMRVQLCLATPMGQVNWRRAASRLEPWWPFVLLLFFGFLAGPGYVRDAVTDSSAWHWFKFGVWVFVMASLAWTCVGQLRRRGRTPVPPTMAPEAVPAADIDEAIATTPDRISAIKALREQHTGLGLRDAVHLIDRNRPR